VHAVDCLSCGVVGHPFLDQFEFLGSQLSTGIEYLLEALKLAHRDTGLPISL